MLKRIELNENEKKKVIYSYFKFGKLKIFVDLLPILNYVCLNDLYSDKFYDYFILNDTFYFNDSFSLFNDSFYDNVVDINDSTFNDKISYDKRNADSYDCLFDNKTIKNQFISYFIFNDVQNDNKNTIIFNSSIGTSCFFKVFNQFYHFA